MCALVLLDLERIMRDDFRKNWHISHSHYSSTLIVCCELRYPNHLYLNSITSLAFVNSTGLPIPIHFIQLRALISQPFVCVSMIHIESLLICFPSIHVAAADNNFLTVFSVITYTPLQMSFEKVVFYVMCSLLPWGVTKAFILCLWR